MQDTIVPDSVSRRRLSSDSIRRVPLDIQQLIAAKLSDRPWLGHPMPSAHAGGFAQRLQLQMLQARVDAGLPIVFYDTEMSLDVSRMINKEGDTHVSA